MNNDVSLILSKILPSDYVLDVGGWASPFNRADKVIDIMPYESRSMDSGIGEIREHFKKEDWIQRDLCDREPWPFKDKEFDFVFCSHTLEDLRDPIWVCSEIIRVGKRGYIEVPTRDLESTTGIDPYPGSENYAGYCHHRWLVELIDGVLTFSFKTPFLSADEMLRQISCDGQRYISFFWEGGFKFRENILLNYEEIKNDCLRFKNRNRLGGVTGNPVEKEAFELNALGEGMFKAHRLEEAKQHFQKAHEIAGDFVPAINNLGVVLWQQGRREDAFSHFFRSVQIDVRNTDALSNFLSSGYTLGSMKEIEDFLEKLKLMQYSKIVEAYREGYEVWNVIFSNDDIVQPDSKKVIRWRKYVESLEMNRYETNLREICEYAGEDFYEVKTKSPNAIPTTLGSDFILAREWSQAIDAGMGVTNEEDVTDFYKRTMGYIYSLIFHDISNNQFSYHYFCMQLCKQFGMDDVFEFGAGIGSQAMVMKVAGMEITASDLDGHTRDFSVWRFERNELDIKSFILEDDAPLLSCKNIICFDVLEHLVNPVKALMRIYNALQKHGKFLLAHACGIPDCSAGTHLESNTAFADAKFSDVMKRIGFKQLVILTGFEGQSLTLWERV